MTIDCPTCRRKLQIAADVSGGSFQCPACGVVFEGPLVAIPVLQAIPLAKPVAVNPFEFGWSGTERSVDPAAFQVAPPDPEIIRNAAIARIAGDALQYACAFVGVAWFFALLALGMFGRIYPPASLFAIVGTLMLAPCILIVVAGGSCFRAFRLPWLVRLAALVAQVIGAAFFLGAVGAGFLTVFPFRNCPVGEQVETTGPPLLGYIAATFLVLSLLGSGILAAVAGARASLALRRPEIQAAFQERNSRSPHR